MGQAIAKIGCCGFPVARPKYFQIFSLVEIQQTFYQPPKPDTAERWRQEAPPGFKFTLKAWQLITHEASSPTYRRLKTPLSEKEKKQIGAFRFTDVVRRAWKRTLVIARLLHADKLIFQCPASFAPTSENKDRMREFFRKIERSGITCIWEPRAGPCASRRKTGQRGKWQNDQIAALCRELNLIHCVDPLKDECVTGRLRCYRLHGIGGYHHEYTDKELHDLAQRCTKGAETYFLVNNVSMWRDAVRFKELPKQPSMPVYSHPLPWHTIACGAATKSELHPHVSLTPARRSLSSVV